MTSQITHKRILKIALPMLISNATIPILGAVDTGVIGQLGDPILLAAVGIGSIAISTIYWLFGFLRMGTTGLVAQACGINDQSEVFSWLIRGLLIGLLSGLALILFSAPLFWLTLQLFQALPEVEEEARKYLNVRIWSAPLSISTFAVLGWLIALERTLYVLSLQITVNLVNITLNLIFVLQLGWGIEGVALATLLAEAVGAFLALAIIIRLFRKNGSPKIYNLFSMKKWKKMCSTNVNILIRSILLEVVIVSYVFFGSTLGTATLAANHILLQFVHISSYALDGFAFSAEALVGMATGRKSKYQIRATAIKSSLWAFGCATIATIFFYSFGDNLINFMIKDAQVQQASKIYLLWMAITPISGVFSFMFDGIFIGATQTIFMRKAMIQSVLAYFISILVLFPIIENHGLWLSINIFFIARAISLGRYYPAVENLRKNKEEYKKS